MAKKAGWATEHKKSSKAIQDFYALGLRILRADEQSPQRGEGKNHWGVFAAIHEETGVSRTEFEKARLFAKYFTPDDVDWLCELGSAGGKPLNKSHIVFLLNVPDKLTRRSLANRAAKAGWSVKQLASEIRKALPRRSSGGKRPPRPATINDALVEIERVTEKWLRLYKTLQPPDNDEECDGVSVKDLPRIVMTTMSKSVEQLRELHEKVGKKIDAK